MMVKATLRLDANVLLCNDIASHKEGLAWISKQTMISALLAQVLGA